MKDVRLDEVYLFHLEKAYKQFKKYKTEQFRKHGINLTSDQWILLKRLSENDKLNQKQLAELSYKEPASITRILDILENKGLVNRLGDPKDRRNSILALTPSGTELVRKFTPLAQEIRAQGIDGIPEDQVTVLRETLHKVFENFS